MTRAVICLTIALTAACGPGRKPPATPAPTVAALSPLARLQHDLAAIFDAPVFEHAFWSVAIGRADSSERLFALNPGKLMMPGSVMKIVTAAVAAEVLGWDHRFETRVITTAPIQDSTLRGDIVIVGGGDPSISERSDTPGVLSELAREVRNAGIARIEGGIIGDDDLFDDRVYGDGWTLDNLPYGYSAPVSALEYNEGSVDLVVRAGASPGDPVTIHVRPEGSGLDIVNQLETIAETGAGTLTLHRLPGSRRLTVRGMIPAKAEPFVRTASVDNPTIFFAAAFRRALLSAGVEVAGDAADIDEFAAKPDLTSGRTLGVRSSPPIRELLSSMMRVSQNQYAELMLKAIGGRARAQSVLRSWSIGDGSYVLADGSGLSRYNYVTSDALVHLLRVMRSNPNHGRTFVETLPLVGRDGTLATRLAGTAAVGKLRAKTGTVDNVRAIAGYVDTADGDTFVFSIIANNFTGSNAAVDAAADKALVRLATFSAR